jgi:cell division protein FtsL
MLYEQGNGVKATTRVHGLTGVANEGDSGSPVMDATGKVIGMISAGLRDLNLCITMEEVSKAKKHILNRLIPLPVGCTAHESALLGRVYWGERSGKSIVEMDALATAMNAQYFAVAHDGVEAHAEAHAFTFHVLWWEIFLGSEHLKENISQCLCKANSFIDSHHALHTKDGLQVACGCSENACRNKNSYRKRFGEDNDRRWAIYKAMNSKSGENGHYVPSKESIAGTLDKEMEEFKSEYKLNSGVVIAVVIAVVCICATIVIIWLKEATRKLEETTRKLEETTRKLEEANKECEDLKEQQQQPQQVPENAEAANLNMAE